MPRAFARTISIAEERSIRRIRRVKVWRKRTSSGVVCKAIVDDLYAFVPCSISRATLYSVGLRCTDMVFLPRFFSDNDWGFFGWLGKVTTWQRQRNARTHLPT